MLLTSGATATLATGPGFPVAACAVQAQLGSVTLGHVDANGVTWKLSTLEGWEGLESTGEATQREQSHGSWLGDAWFGPRVVTLEGRIITDSWRDASQAADALLSSVPLKQPEPLVVSETPTGRVLQAEVRQHRQPLIRREVGGAHVVYSLSLLAPDPRRYSVTQHSASTGLPSTSGGLTLPFTLPVTLDASVTTGRVQAHNAGNLDSPPLVTVSGPCPPFTVTHLGTHEALEYHDDLPAGRFLELDFRDRTALLDGTAVRRVTGSWFSLAPGDNEVAFGASAYNPSASMQVQWRDAWR